MSDANTLRSALLPLAGDRLLTARLASGRATIVVDAAGLDTAQQTALEQALLAAARGLSGVDEVAVAMTAARQGVPAAPPAPLAKPRLIAVASGKGGVGKSTLAANLAVALARAGHPVGLVDADIHGPSQTVLLGREDAKPEAEGGKLHPVATRFGFSFLSMGQLAAPGTAIAWRGPMAGNALSQLVDAHWGEARTLIVDLPPGTGDVQLSMVQKHKPAGALIISTPQDLALIDATRAIAFFDKASVPLIGLVENMAGYLCPHCGELSDPFGRGGAEAAAEALGLPFLGRIPLDIAIRRASDAGDPPAAGDSPQGRAFTAIAERVAEWLAANPGPGEASAKEPNHAD